MKVQHYISYQEGMKNAFMFLILHIFASSVYVGVEERGIFVILMLKQKSKMLITKRALDIHMSICELTNYTLINFVQKTFSI